MNSVARSSISGFRNKENLLKMEIESGPEHTTRSVYLDETKKISWKWRLKDREDLSCLWAGDRWETKKISWKWRLKVDSRSWLGVFVGEETKKISWKWRLKVDGRGRLRSCERLRNKENLLKMEIESRASILSRPTTTSGKQRKSPENGDWKLPISSYLLRPPCVGNKENLLKMEIERFLAEW